MFRGTSAVRAGLLSPDQLRSSAWRRLRQDVYVDARLPLTHLVQALGVRLVAPPEAAFGGLTAVALWGGEGFAGRDDPVEVVVPPGARWRPSPGVVVRTATLDGDVVRPPRALPRTSRVRTAVDLVRRGPVDDGVVLLDRLVAAGLVRLPEVRDAVAGLPRCRGSRSAREVAALADGLAESPQETRLRLLMHRAGLPAPTPQHRVVDDEGFVARLDFAYPARKVAIEYDGAWHAEPGQFARDRRRLNRLTAAGWRVVFVTAADLRDPAALVRRIAAELDRW
ncbi:G:T-mismatch repair DNA endonuclease, very short patch repair protein [Blastococcus tunisiensis]|uniref:G:T-mismatch repair DNA endonuclease, very short patch repair protein n=1 Tax=Blastococcus tunisiensis TaxID=1798228 RepID=A0A1I1WC53_9ACTN|nr:G:T-mismatch repair DNA endonuclease, very short patch repair protein [Blastococcus sp. DSM 46838]